MGLTSPDPATPAVRLGVKPYDEVEYYASKYWGLQSHDEENRRRNRLDWPSPWAVATSRCSWSSRAAETAYLEGKWSECIEWSEELVQSTIHYFFGDWKTRVPTDDGVIDPDWWFASRNGWGMKFGDGIAWGSIGRHWDGVDKIMQFPSPGVATDADGRPIDAYHRGLALWWTDRSEVNWIEETRRTRGSGSRLIRSLCDAVEGISEHNEGQLAKGLTQYVKDYQKARDNNLQFPLAASFLSNVAERDGLSIKLPEETAKFLFRIPEEYWEGITAP